MPNYRRNLLPGGTYFFTVTVADRGSHHLVAHIGLLRRAVRQVRAERPFAIDAWVVLPDHMHCVWTLPPGDADYPTRWKAIKSIFAKSLPQDGPLPANTRAGERGFWQRRYWEHTIRDDRDFAAHVDYTHFNPVKHGFTHSAGEWPFSSFRRAVTAGHYPADWAVAPGNTTLEAGEP